MQQYSEDLEVFFNTLDFAITATYNGKIRVNGIMGEASNTVNDVETISPMFTYAEKVIPKPKHGDSLVADGVTYTVVGVHADGIGVAVLILEKQ